MQDGFDTRFEKWFLDRFGKDYRDTYFVGDMYDFIASEISKAREEVIKNLIKKIEEANCDSISLEFLREIDLSKLTTK